MRKDREADNVRFTTFRPFDGFSCTYTYTSLCVVQRPYSNDSIAVHFTGKRPCEHERIIQQCKFTVTKNQPNNSSLKKKKKLVEFLSQNVLS